MDNPVLVFIIYIIVVIASVIFQIYSIRNDKSNQVRWSIDKLKIAFLRNTERLKTVEGMSEILLTFYRQYSDEHKKFAKFYPNYIVWLDAVIYRVDTMKKIDVVFIDNADILKKARYTIAAVRPFYQCSNSQGKLLSDIEKLKNENSDIVIDNILKRLEEEFVSFNEEKEKNRISGKISTALGITGIIVSVIMGILSLI